MNDDALEAIKQILTELNQSNARILDIVDGVETGLIARDQAQQRQIDDLFEAFDQLLSIQNKQNQAFEQQINDIKNRLQ